MNKNNSTLSSVNSPLFSPGGAQNIVKLYYHHDHLGSTDYLTDNVAGKVTSYATYDDWGMLTAKAIVMMGVRKLDLVQEYTGHPYDQVLGIYYAKARMYDAADRRFMAVDAVKGDQKNPQTIVQYTYVLNNSLVNVDPLGKWKEDVHYGKTKEWATAGVFIYNGMFVVGYFTEAAAEVIADADNKVDKNPATTPFIMIKSNLSWHFDMNGFGQTDSREEHYKIQLREAARLWPKDDRNDISTYNAKKAALEAFGKGLHALQDKDAHLGWNPYIYPFVHTAYMDKFGCIDASTASASFFDDPRYDLSFEQRTLKYNSLSEDTFYEEAYIWVAREGAQRIIETERKTKVAFAEFIFAIDIGAAEGLPFDTIKQIITPNNPRINPMTHL